MIYICPNCGKQYAHKGDFEKHTTKRQKSCVRPTEQSLADRLRAIEAALIAAGQLNLPVVEETTMENPPSRTEAAAQGILDYPAFIQNWLAQGDRRQKGIEKSKVRRHATLDELIENFHMFDLMRRIPPGSKLPQKQQLIEQYFQGNFTNPGGENIPVVRERTPAARENVARADPVEPAAPVVPIERPPPVIHYAPDRIFREPEVDRTREKAAEDKLFALLVSCENDLRPECVGAEAQNTIMQLLVIKVIQPILEQSDILDAEKYGYDKREIDGPLVGCALLKNLVQVESMGISSVFRRVIDYIYTRHPLTRGVFMDHYYATLPDIKFKKVLMKLYEFQFDPESHDILGSAYQRFVYESNKSNVGSRLGQHFTPKGLVNLLMSLNRQFFVAGGTVCDPFMGTGGILMQAYNSLGRPSPDKIFGTEITRNVFQCAAGNMALSVGVLPPGVRCADAFDTTGQFDNIFTNPPFGIKGMRAQMIGGSKTTNCDALCANMLMDRLAQGGVCSFVWIKGKILKKMEKAMLNVRKRLFENFEVIGIVMVPPSFEYTTIKTVVITFRNSGRRNDWLTFYQYNPNSPDLVDVIGSFDADQVKKAGYALTPKAYRPGKRLVSNSSFSVKKLSEICDIRRGSSINIDQLINGEYPVIGGGMHPKGMHNEFNSDENMIFISGSGSYSGFVSRYPQKTYAAGDVNKLTQVTINNDYLYYYLKYVRQAKLHKSKDGACIPHVGIETLREFQIHIPSPERQIELAQIMKQIDSAINQTRQLLEGHRKIHDEFVSRPFLFAADCPITTLGTICKFKAGPDLTKDKIKGGDYKVFGGGKNIKGMYTEFNADPGTITISCGGNYAGVVLRHNEKVYIARGAYIMLFSEEYKEYGYYYLKYMRQKDIYKLAESTTQPNLSTEILSNLEIHLPPSEIMQQCVDFFYQTRNMLQRMEEDEQNLLAIIARYEEALRMYFPPE